MPDPLSGQVTPGQKIEIRADTWNSILKACRQVIGAAASPLEGARLASAILPASTVLVRNDTGSSAGIRAVYRLGDPLVTATSAPEEFQGRPAFEGLTPAAWNDPVAVASEPAATGSVVRAAVAGIVVAKVDVTSASHGYAAVSPGVSAHFVSSESSTNAAILWKPVGETGVVECVVLLTQWPGVTFGAYGAPSRGAAGVVPTDFAVKKPLEGAYSTVIDNGSASYSTAWNSDTDPNSYGGNRRYTNQPSYTATYTFTGLKAGLMYEVQACWNAWGVTPATEVKFSVYRSDGTTLIDSWLVDQSADSAGGRQTAVIAFQRLGTVKALDTSIKVVISSAQSLYKVADAVWVTNAQDHYAATVVDDDDGDYAETGSWSDGTDAAAEGGNYRLATGPTPTATYTFQDLVAGNVYKLTASWVVPAGTPATEVSYQVNQADGSTVVALFEADHSSPSAGEDVDGVLYETLGEFVAPCATLEVVVSTLQTAVCVADAVRLVDMRERHAVQAWGVREPTEGVGRVSIHEASRVTDGVVTRDEQTFAGPKDFTNRVTVNVDQDARSSGGFFRVQRNLGTAPAGYDQSLFRVGEDMEYGTLQVYTYIAGPAVVERTDDNDAPHASTPGLMCAGGVEDGTANTSAGFYGPAAFGPYWGDTSNAPPVGSGYEGVPGLYHGGYIYGYAYAVDYSSAGDTLSFASRWLVLQSETAGTEAGFVKIYARSQYANTSPPAGLAISPPPPLPPGYTRPNPNGSMGGTLVYGYLGHLTDSAYRDHPTHGLWSDDETGSPDRVKWGGTLTTGGLEFYRGLYIGGAIDVGGGVIAGTSPITVTDDGDGTVTLSLATGGVGTTHLAGDAVTFAKMQNIATDRLIGRDTTGSGDPEEISVGGGLEFSGSGGIQVANDGITDARLRNSSAWSVIGRESGTTGDPADIAVNSDTLTNFLIYTPEDELVVWFSVAASRIVGTDSSGFPSEISVGSGLSLSGGVLSATGGGSLPDRVIEVFVPADQMRVEVGSTAAFGTVTSGGWDLRHIAFDKSTDEFAQFVWRLPESWDSGVDVVVKFHWSHASGPVSDWDVVWTAQAQPAGNGEDRPGFSSALSVTDSGDGTADRLFTSAYTADVGLAMAGASPGDLVCFRIGRDANDAADLLDTDARLEGVTIRYGATGDDS